MFQASETMSRTKPPESFLRKCRREGVEDLSTIPNKIEDILGIRIVTASKPAARSLFEYFQQNADSWFCEVTSRPKFVPYTPEDNNRYSLRSGYRAYHVTFVLKNDYRPFSDQQEWPVEVQIMSRLWQFWAEYSRRYFYLSDDTMAQRLLPYNVAISKILDTADDLITANLEFLGRAGDEDDAVVPGDLVAEGEPAAPGEADEDEDRRMTISEVRSWFTAHLSEYFGNARMPTEFYLYKIADELAVYGINADDLTDIFDDTNVALRYHAILQASQVGFLPPYQQILAKLLLFLDRDDDTVVEHVNSYLGPLPVTLVTPATR